MLSLDFPSMVTALSFSLLRIVMAAGSVVLTLVVLKIKRTIAFAALIFLIFGINELLIALFPKDSIIFLPFVYLAVFVSTGLYPLANLIVRREYAPILIGSVITFISFFEKIGAGINSILGSIIFEVFGNFDLLIILEGAAAILLSLLLLGYIFVSKDSLIQKLKEREPVQADDMKK